jgi:hypothetical protein
VLLQPIPVVAGVVGGDDHAVGAGHGLGGQGNGGRVQPFGAQGLDLGVVEADACFAV